MQLPINRAIGTFAPNFLAGHDSATAMVESLSKYLHGKPAGSSVPAGQWHAKIINALPATVRQKLYAASGILDAIDPDQVGALDPEEFCHWVYNLYPKRSYPVIAVGASNGALIHLWAALGIPWLPQTMLIPLRKPSDISVDEPLKNHGVGGRARCTVCPSQSGVATPPHDGPHPRPVENRTYRLFSC